MTSNILDAAVDGLSEREAAERLVAKGRTSCRRQSHEARLPLLSRSFMSRCSCCSLACGTIYLLLGDPQEALMLLGFVFLVAGITLYQERKTERALEALRDLSSPRALVIRDGEQRASPAERSCGVTRSSSRKATACRPMPSSSRARNLSTDESLLTGESVPVGKVPWDGASALGPPGGEGLPFVFSGTLVNRARRSARPRARPGRDRDGHDRQGPADRDPTERSALQRETGDSCAGSPRVAARLCVVVVIAYGLTRGDWLSGVPRRPDAGDGDHCRTSFPSS